MSANVEATIVVAAVVPPLLYGLVIAALDRGRRPWAAMLAAFLWGAVVASASAARLNDLLLGWLTSATGEAQARSLAAVAGAPVVEETLKGAALLVLLLARPDLLRSARDGIVYGALIGLGFDAAENVDYLMLAAVQGGSAGLARGVWVRAMLGGLKHAVFTATLGAGLGWAREVGGLRRHPLIPLLAFAAALAQHAAWNSVASTAITKALCGAVAPDAACLDAPTDAALLVSVPLIVLCFIAPGAVALLAIARRGAPDR